MKVFLMLAAAALSASAASYYLTVAGLGGEPDYEQRFTGWANDQAKYLGGDSGAKVETLTGKAATKVNILARLSAIAAQAKAEDTFVLLLIGHGTYDDIDYKFNVPGPDISASELATALDRIPARQLVVLGSSASGAAIEKLRRERRIVITATRSGTEKNATVFARYWVEAFRDPAADTDKNDTLTALEAYRYAKAKTKDYFDTQKRLATEHSLLEDTGKGVGEADPSAANGQGLLAGRFPLLRLGASASAAAMTPAKQALLQRKDQLETAIDELKYRQAAMDAATYNQRMRQLLLDLAKVQAELDQ
jgi:hypothetical protein